MKRFAGLQSRTLVHGSRPRLQARKFATNNEHVVSAPKPQAEAQAQAQSDKADLEKPGQDGVLFDNEFEVNVNERTIATAAGPLPISPLLDPRWREARTRAHEKEARPHKSKLNRFQRQLYQNPFGKPQDLYRRVTDANYGV